MLLISTAFNVVDVILQEAEKLGAAFATLHVLLFAILRLAYIVIYYAYIPYQCNCLHVSQLKLFILKL